VAAWKPFGRSATSFACFSLEGAGAAGGGGDGADGTGAGASATALMLSARLGRFPVMILLV
jgi:hypothetical protein